MTDQDKLLGRLESLSEQNRIEHTSMNGRFDRMDMKIDRLMEFRATVLSSAKTHATWISCLITGAGGLLTMLITFWIRKHGG